MPHLVAVDLETSGLNPDIHEIIEIGLVFERDGFTKMLEFSVAFDEEKADPQALEINGWGRRPFAPAWSNLTAAATLDAVLEDAHLVGKNPSFDAAFLRQWFKNTGYTQPTWHHRMIDIGNVCQGRFGMLYPPNTEQVEEATGVRIGAGRHSALADARWAWDVLHYLVSSRP